MAEQLLLIVWGFFSASSVVPTFKAERKSVTYDCICIVKLSYSSPPSLFPTYVFKGSRSKSSPITVDWSFSGSGLLGTVLKIGAIKGRMMVKRVEK